AAENGVAMRKAAEAFDDVAVLPGVAQLLGLAEIGEQEDASVLVVQLLAVLKGHVEEAPLPRFEFLVEALVDRTLGDGERQMVGRELVGVAPEHVPWELIEENDPGERG